MKVSEIVEGIRVEPNNIYLTPPNKNVAIINGRLYLVEPIKNNGINLPIDYFFKSMSQFLKEKAICIILSGTASDGTQGLKVVKEQGGMAMVQSPESAKYDGMPRSAISTGLVDFILPVEKMPAAILKYIQTPYIGGIRRAIVTNHQYPEYIPKVFAHIQAATGHDFSQYKQNSIRRRIERRMAVHQIDNISDYEKYISNTPVEIEILFKDILIGVTNFFRNAEAFKFLRLKAVPELLESRDNNSQLRIWVVGCSTGEEAYSIAILFLEAMNKLKKHLNIQIYATDIDPQAIDYARAGIYPESIAADLSKKRLNQYFLKENNYYKVKKQVREMIIFAIQDIIKDPPFSKMDLISCRNLLIYMDNELHKKVLSLFHYALNEEGLLFLGPSETIGDFNDLFQSLSSKWKIYKHRGRMGELSVKYPDIPYYQSFISQGDNKKRIPVKVDIQDAAERIIIENYSPSCVLINERFDIVHFIGKTDKYLEPPRGKASFNILKMARESLRFKLNTALHNAIKQKMVITYDSLQIKYNNEIRIIDLTVRPLIDADMPAGFMMVIFHDKTPLEKPGQKKGRKVIKNETDSVVARLEQELLSTKEHLQSTIEEMETSNEELKSTNEEMQSINEELQSTNEELETSKEELQSTNEELVTVNNELQKKVDELSQVNNYINNLLASTDIGTIFLDTNHRIKLFTPAMTKIFNLLQTDIGRPISDITTKLKYENLVKDAEEVLNTLIKKEVEVQDKKSNWFTVHILPYRTTENVIDGIVMTFVDINSIRYGKKLEKELAEGKKLHEGLKRDKENLQELVDQRTAELNREITKSKKKK